MCSVDEIKHASLCPVANSFNVLTLLRFFLDLRAVANSFNVLTLLRFFLDLRVFCLIGVVRVILIVTVSSDSLGGG